MDKIFISKKIDEVIKTLIELKNSINYDSDSTEKIISNFKLITSEQHGDFEDLKELLLSDKWPAAVNPNLICDPSSEIDKKERGIGIVELLVEDFLSSDDNFLDYGCGEGHCAAAALSALGCKLSVGYDIKKFNWTITDNTTFTSSYEEVKSLGPYKAILIFDVLDHSVEDTPVELLTKAANLLDTDGKIYLRCHPWISRHGTHLYHFLNKAYAHLVFTDEELTKLSDHISESNLNVSFPLKTYEEMFEDSNLKIINERKIIEKVEPFFKIPKINERIIRNTKHKQFPEFQMGLSFIDYVLRKK
ncbi:MAG: methyltransferase domain-containing protein [bacterium]